MVKRVLIADDYPVVREGIKSILDPAHYEVCGEASNGKEAVEEARNLKPDLIVLDVSMPLMNGVEALQKIRAADPSMKIVLFTMHSEVHQRGDAALVSKSEPVAILLQAIDEQFED